MKRKLAGVGMRLRASNIDRALRQSIAVIAVAAAVVALPVKNASGAQVVAKHADWMAYMHDDGQEKLCFAVSQPKDRQPTAVKRDPPHFYVTAWPKSGVKAEISIKMGYPVKKGSEVSISVDQQPFKLFAEADRVFVADPEQEAKLIEALKKGQRLSVQAVSERGTTTLDTYSLAGVTQALQSVTTACP